MAKTFNLISQRRILHVPHWSMSEFRGLRDCGTGLLRLDRDSYWVHSSLGSDKGLRASDESDNGSCPWLCPIVFNFLEERKWKEVKKERGRRYDINAEYRSLNAVKPDTKQQPSAASVGVWWFTRLQPFQCGRVSSQTFQGRSGGAVQESTKRKILLYPWKSDNFDLISRSELSN